MLRIVSWNCGGKLREKCIRLSSLEADIYIVQECEDPSFYTSTVYSDFSSNYLWIGEKSKGLGVFAKNNVAIHKLEWATGPLRYFLPFEADKNKYVAIWAKSPYIEEIYIWLYFNKCFIDGQTTIIGDFNSNSIWDKKHKGRDHSSVVKMLTANGLSSAYHFVYNENQGEETKPTFFLNKNLEKKYHIDYAFLPSANIAGFSIGGIDWLEYSDHLPIILDIN